MHEEEDRLCLERLLQLRPEIRQATERVREFHGIVRERQSTKLDAWLTKAAVSDPLGLANSLRKDILALRAALTLTRSSGQTEGQRNRLKLLKR